MDRQSKAYRTVVTLERRALGIGFLVLLMMGGWLTHAIFEKAFTDYERVELRSSRTGLQLVDRAEVKVRGVTVGEVLETRATSDGAVLTLGLFPDEIVRIPANVSARILPKTLFGEKYVALQLPAEPVGEPISAGDVVEEADVAIEVEKVLNDFYPFLRTVQPAELNYTLTAMATALEGRGEAIGENFVILNDYLKRTNPQLPLFIEDLRLLGEVSEDYREVLPEVARLLRNSVTTGNTFVQKERKIQALFDDVAGFSDTSRDFLEQNGDNIIRLGEVSVPQLRLYERYAPEYPCLLQGQADWIPQMNNGWRGHTLHINLEQLPEQPTGYSPGDDPEYDAENGPHCETLPSPPYDQSNPGPQPKPHEVDDGVESGHGKHRASLGFDLTTGFAGTAAERSLVESLAGPVMGVAPDDVPDVATLLFGPLARGTEVSLR